MDNWNPLHIAVAFKRTELVRYLIEDVKVSLRLFGGKPLDANASSNVETETFALWLAVSNKDTATLEELLSHYRAWDIEHLTQALKYIATDRWTTGVSYVLNSHAAKTIFSSLSSQDQAHVARQWLALRKDAPGDFQKALDDGLCHSPYSLLTIFNLLDIN